MQERAVARKEKEQSHKMKKAQEKPSTRFTDKNCQVLALNSCG
jgi:hypothetical protein